MSHLSNGRHVMASTETDTDATSDLLEVKMSHRPNDDSNSDEHIFQNQLNPLSACRNPAEVSMPKHPHLGAQAENRLRIRGRVRC